MALPKIPSLPLSYRDALPLLQSLRGIGLNSALFDSTENWVGSLDIEYWTGPGNVMVNLNNDVEYKITPIWNVIATIEGTTDKHETVILGNHRDAWVFGAVDPVSGTVALLEVARSFGKLLKTGWKPRRNIVFASWVNISTIELIYRTLKNMQLLDPPNTLSNI